ncbi:MAG: ABC transporter ATP-binding protein [Candidatus Aenigmarchaeota archaeon]|nr:ABC transporter ATP-binding protein [Candidatus Aenigmarchaeota archaeon]
MKPLIELKNVKKIYRMGNIDVKALNGVNLKINRNELISIIGPSGSGKSTLLDVMCCLNRPTEGKVFIEGRDTSKMNDDELAYIRGRKIGFVFQTFNLIQRLTALENVMLPMWFVGKPEKERRRRAMKVLNEVGLKNRANHKPSEMSGGERQRVAIARALVNDPPIIVGDEPTGNLDSKSGMEILKIFEKLHKQGRTVIIVTHDIKIANKTKRKIHIRDGKIEKEVIK